MQHDGGRHPVRIQYTIYESGWVMQPWDLALGMSRGVEESSRVYPGHQTDQT